MHRQKPFLEPFLALVRVPVVVALALVAGLAACAGGGGERAGEDPQAPPADLVLALIDTWRWDALGANVGSDVSPELDALAAGGVRFTRAFASAPWTLPSVASTLTGRFPTVHGAYGRYQDAAGIRAELPTLAMLARDAGYRTVAVTSAPFLSPDFGFDRGFDVYRHLPTEEGAVPRAGRIVDLALELAAAEGGGDDARPLFLMLHVFDPHLPLDPPEPWDARWTAGYTGKKRPPLNPRRAMRSGDYAPSEEDLAFLLGLYSGEVGYASVELGRFFERFAELRAERERLVVLTADHGEEFGEHGGWEHGHAMYRELVQVPLVVVPPVSWHVRPATIDTQVRLVDVLPTFLEAARMPPPEGLPGRSLAPLMRGEETDDRPALSEREHLGRPSRAYRSGRFALIEYLDDGSVELFDQRADPDETRDLASERPELVSALRAEAQALVARQLEEAAEYGALDPDLDEDLAEQLRSLGYLEGADGE